MHKEILEKAVRKAVENGWRHHVWPRGKEVEYMTMEGVDVRPILFSHDFAKALWGDYPVHFVDQYAPTAEAKDDLGNWQYHLQQMVVADDPIRYLGENI